MRREGAAHSFARVAFAELGRWLSRPSQSVLVKNAAAEGHPIREVVADALVEGVFVAMCEVAGFSPPPASTEARCSKGANLYDALASEAAVIARGAMDLFRDHEALGHFHEALLGFDIGPSFEARDDDARRRSGSHYTPRALADEVVDEALGPFCARATRESILALRVCDPAMGTGAFAFAAARRLARALVEHGVSESDAYRLALLGSIRGVDADARAIDVAKKIAWLTLGDSGRTSLDALESIFVVGDALIGASPGRAREPTVDLAKVIAKKSGAPASPLDWARTFKDVFTRENPGFDAFVGNPPFIGGKRIRTMLGAAYADWLRRIHPGANGNVDLSAHFIRRSFDLVREGGRIGFITTNTIAQGDTRTGGLAHVVAHGGVIASARTRVEWPSHAAVVVSIVFIEKRKPTRAKTPPCLLDGRPVSSITAFLRDGHESSDPARIPARQHIAFIGCFLRGMGFTFDDDNPAASPLSLMRHIVEADPKAAHVIRPYIGGEEVNSSPTHAHHRYAVDLFGLSETEARRDYPALMEMLEKKVRPAREALGSSSADRAHRARWWRFANERSELRARMKGLAHVLVIPRVSANLSVVALSTDRVFSEQLVVVGLDDWASFAILQSRLHEVWARRHASTLGDGLRYTPSDCFETFPFPPPSHASSDALSSVGRAYSEHRARVMRDASEGLTATWRRIHDPKETRESIHELRRLQDAMDHAVLVAYGFDDLIASPCFEPDPRRHPRGKDAIAMRYGFGEGVEKEIHRRLLLANRDQGASG